MGDLKTPDEVRLKNTSEKFSSPSMNALNLPSTNNFKRDSSGSTEVNYAIGNKPLSAKYKKGRNSYNFFSLDEEQDKIMVLQCYSPEFEANRKISIRTGAEVIEDHDDEADEGDDDDDYDDEDNQNSTNSNSSDPKGIKELVTLYLRKYVRT